MLTSNCKLRSQLTHTVGSSTDRGARLREETCNAQRPHRTCLRNTGGPHKSERGDRPREGTSQEIPKWTTDILFIREMQMKTTRQQTKLTPTGTAKINRKDSVNCCREESHWTSCVLLVGPLTEATRRLRATSPGASVSTETCLRTVMPQHKGPHSWT